jgi:hypothetical protein
MKLVSTQLLVNIEKCFVTSTNLGPSRSRSWNPLERNTTLLDVGSWDEFHAFSGAPPLPRAQPSTFICADMGCWGKSGENVGFAG